MTDQKDFIPCKRSPTDTQIPEMVHWTCVADEVKNFDKINVHYVS